MKRFFAIVFAAATLCGCATVERGDYSTSTLELSEISTLGDNAFRFSSRPALGGPGYVFELVRHENSATASITWTYSDRNSVSSLGHRDLSLGAAEFDQLTRTIDSFLAEGAPPLGVSPRAEEEVVVVCTDGPGYRSERVHQRQVTRLDGFCSGFDRPHPNRQIADLLLLWAFHRLAP